MKNSINYVIFNREDFMVETSSLTICLLLLSLVSNIYYILHITSSVRICIFFPAAKIAKKSQNVVFAVVANTVAG